MSALDNGGCTFRISASGDLVLLPHTEGYMVSCDASVHGIGEHKIRVDSATPVSVVAYEDIVLRAKRVLEAAVDSYWVGLWVDGGYLYIDISIHVKDLGEAMRLGRKWGQQAIYDIAKGKSLEVVRRAPRYCSVTSEPMFEGWCIGDGDAYIKYESDALKAVEEAGFSNLEEAYNDGFIYWTEWHDIEVEDWDEEPSQAH